MKMCQVAAPIFFRYLSPLQGLEGNRGKKTLIRKVFVGEFHILYQLDCAEVVAGGVAGGELGDEHRAADLVHPYGNTVGADEGQVSFGVSA